MEWISVKERLPKEYEDIFIFDGDLINRGYLDPKQGFMSFFKYLSKHDKKVLYWMPMPKPPTK